MTVTVTTRTVKGSPLTHAELDANFDDLAAQVNTNASDNTTDHAALDARLTTAENDIDVAEAAIDVTEADIVLHDGRLDTLETHAASTGNTHSMVKSDISLGDVTNDAQLKRAAADFSTFTAKAAPVAADILLIEDSEATEAKKSVELSNLQDAIGLSNVTNDAQLKRADSDFLTFSELTTPVMQDVVLIEQADGTKKYIQLGNIPSTGASSEADIYQDVLAASKYQHATYDDLNDEDLIDGTNTDATYNANDTRYDFTVGEVIESDDLYDTDAGLSAVTECLVLAIYTDSGTPTIEATADGTNWETVTLNTVHTFTNTGTTLQLRFTAGGTGHLDSWAIFYNPDTQAIVEPVDWLKWNNLDPDDMDLNPNLLINGDFRIWQRGTSFTTANEYTADRWKAYNKASATKLLVTTIGSLGQSDNGIEVQSSGATQCFLRQYIEAESIRMNVGQTHTLSFWVKSTGGTGTLSAAIYSLDAKDDSSAVTLEEAVELYAVGNVPTDWTYVTHTFAALPTDCANGIELRLYRGNTDQSTTHYARCKLEVGSVATPFVSRPKAEELALCQRYYQIHGPGMSGVVYDSTSAHFGSLLPVTMREAPTATLLDTTPTMMAPSAKTGSGSTIAASSLDTIGFRVRVDGFSSLTSGYGVLTSSDDMLALEAEL